MGLSEPRDETGNSTGLVRALSAAAVVRDRHFDIVAANASASALSSTLEPGRNLLRDVFLNDCDVRECTLAGSLPETVVALLRDSLEEHEEDQRFMALVGELSARSILFSQLWAAGATAETSDVVSEPRGGGWLTFTEYRPVGEYEMTVVVFEVANGPMMV